MPNHSQVFPSPICLLHQGLMPNKPSANLRYPSLPSHRKQRHVEFHGVTGWMALLELEHVSAEMRFAIWKLGMSRVDIRNQHEGRNNEGGMWGGIGTCEFAPTGKNMSLAPLPYTCKYLCIQYIQRAA